MTGFVIYHAKRDSFLNWKIYFSRESAESALERVVWHNRDGWEILPMPEQLRGGEAVGRAPEVQQPAPHARQT